MTLFLYKTPSLFLVYLGIHWSCGRSVWGTSFNTSSFFPGHEPAQTFTPTQPKPVSTHVHQEYILHSDRLASYSGWPTYLIQTPKKLAAAGFFYTGKCLYFIFIVSIKTSDGNTIRNSLHYLRVGTYSHSCRLHTTFIIYCVHINTGDMISAFKLQ